MKYIAKILVLMVVFFTIYSCSKDYTDTNPEMNTVVGYPKILGIIQVPIGEDTADFEIEFLTSDLADTDRTFQVSVLEGSNVAVENYTFSPSVVMPANEYKASFIFTAVDTSLPEEWGDVFLGFETNRSDTLKLKIRKEPTP